METNIETRIFSFISVTYESFVVGFSMILSWGYVISDLVRTLTSPERYQPHHLAQHPSLRKNSPIFLLQGKMPGWARRTRTVPWQHRQFLIAERGGRESLSTSRCRELYIHEMFLLSSHLNVTCLPIPFFFQFFIFFQPPNSQVFQKHMKKAWFCVLHAASVSTSEPGWESIREAAMAQKGVTLCAMSLGNETHTTLVGGLGSGGEVFSAF